MGGVLVDLDGTRCIEAFHRLGAYKTADYVVNHLTADLFADIEDGTITTHEFCNKVRMLDNINVSDEDIIWAWNSLIAGMAEEKKQTLLQLSSHYRLFLLSNTNEMHWLHCAEECFPTGRHVAEDYFERIFLSYEMQKVKPNADIYQQVLDDAQIVAEETLFIDDSAVNLEGAASLGIQTFHEQGEANSWVEYANKQLLP